MATKHSYAERYLYLRNRRPADVLGQVKSAAGCWIDCEDENGTLVLLTGDDADFAVDAAMDNDDEHDKDFAEGVLSESPNEDMLRAGQEALFEALPEYTIEERERLAGEVFVAMLEVATKG